MTQEEVKLRQMSNQHLLQHSDPLTVTKDLCGVQSQFFSNAVHSLRIRCGDTGISPELIKNWTVRGTLHLFAAEDLPLYLCSNNPDTYRSMDWSVPSFWNQRSDWALTPKRQALFTECILAALSGHTLTREELKTVCRENGMSDPEEQSMFHPWGGGIRELAERGFIHGLAQEEKTYGLSPIYPLIAKDEAQLELARRYFTYIAPATIHDAMYFFKMGSTAVKRLLDRLPITSTDCQGKTYYYIERDQDYNENIPACLFLAGFDQLMLGYEKKESLYLPAEYMRGIFNLAGIVMPAILLNGQVAGRWKMKNGTLHIESFRSLSKRDETLIREAADSLWHNEIQKITW